MSEKHLYEKHLAEKLQQLSPPPDMEGNWQKMKALLDHDRPRGGFGKRWWQIGVIAAILLIGGWLAGTQYLQTTRDKNPLVAAQPNPANVEKKDALPDKGQPGNNQPRKDGDAVTNGNAPTSTAEGGLVENNRALKTGGNENRKSLKTTPPDTDIGNFKNATALNNRDRKNRNDQNIKTDSKKDDITLHSDKEEAISNKKQIEYSPLNENTTYTSGTPAPADNLKTDFSLLSLHAKEVLKSKSARAARNRQDRSFSFGLSLPLAFPLGDQKALSYNFNGGANTVSDYIPSPHVQYRLSKNTYLQTELQFISPQYIRPILLYETRSNAAGNYMVYNSIYARKLYYFNLPVGIHHSPFKNFYLGTGLQFSSLLTGVGLYEQTKRSLSGDPISLISERYGRLNGDSLTSRMNTAEVRLMLEMNYYFNRFTFGLRYNQAFNNYVNFRIDNMSPYTFDKNKALQFYLRYNLWEDVRRRPNGKGLLSSK